MAIETEQDPTTPARTAQGAAPPTIPPLSPSSELVRAEVHDALRAERDALREALEKGEASDGYHTHRELYEYRMLYNAHAARGWLAAGIPVVKSRRHSDGEICFGGGWFIVVAELPTGQVSNQLPGRALGSVRGSRRRSSPGVRWAHPGGRGGPTARRTRPHRHDANNDGGLT